MKNTGRDCTHTLPIFNLNNRWTEVLHWYLIGLIDTIRIKMCQLQSEISVEGAQSLICPSLLGVCILILFFSFFYFILYILVIYRHYRLYLSCYCQVCFHDGLFGDYEFMLAILLFSFLVGLITFIPSNYSYFFTLLP